MHNSRPQNRLWKIIAMVVLPIALLALPVWWREKMSWRPYPLPAKFYARSIAFSPDSKLLAVGEAGAVSVWDAKNHNLMQTIDTGGIVGCVAFSPNGEAVACAKESNYVTLYNRRDGSFIKGLFASSQIAGGQTVDALSFLPDGQTLAIGLSNGDFQLCNLQTSKTRTLLQGNPNNYNQSVALSDNGKTFARAKRGGIHLYDTLTGKEKAVVPVDGNYAIAFSAKSVRIASIGSDRKIIVTDRETRRQLFSAPAVLDRETALVALSPDGSKVSDGYHIWDVDNGKVERTLDGQRSEGLAFSPDGALLCAGSQYSAELWRIK